MHATSLLIYIYIYIYTCRIIYAPKMGWGGGGRTTIADLTTIAIPGLGFCSLMNVCYNLVYSWFILCFSLTNWAMLETFFSHKTTWGQVLQIIYKLLKQVTFDNNQIPHCPGLPGQLWWLIGALYCAAFCRSYDIE